jgi:hypothetical protein
MMASEPTYFKKFFNLLFLAIVVAAAGVYLFRAELSEAVSDAMAKNAAAVKREWAPGSGGVLVLRPEQNDQSLLKVGALRAGAPSSLGVPVSFDLTNLGDANDFPNLAVVMVGADGSARRTIYFTPTDYSHSNRFENERVELLLQPRPDEHRFTIRAFYGDHP